MDEETKKALQEQLQKMGFIAPEPETDPVVQALQKLEEKEESKDEVSTEDMDGGSF